MEQLDIAIRALSEKIGGLLLSLNIITQSLHKNGVIDKNEIINALDFTINQHNKEYPENNLTAVLDKLSEYLRSDLSLLFSLPEDIDSKMRRDLFQVIEGGHQSTDKDPEK